MLVYNIVSCPFTGFRCAMALLRTNSAHKLVQVMGQEQHGALVNLLYKSFKQELAFFRQAWIYGLCILSITTSTILYYILPLYHLGRVPSHPRQEWQAAQDEGSVQPEGYEGKPKGRLDKL